MPVAWEDFEPVDESIDWDEFEPVDSTSEIRGSSHADIPQSIESQPIGDDQWGGMKKSLDERGAYQDEMRRGYGTTSDFVSEVVNDPGQIPSAIKHGVMAPFGVAGQILRMGMEDIGQWAGAGAAGEIPERSNLLEWFDKSSPMDDEIPLPYQQMQKEVSKTNPAAVAAAKFAGGTAETAPMIAAGMPGGVAGRALSLMFAHDMAAAAGAGAGKIAGEMDKPIDQWDWDEITSGQAEVAMGAMAPFAAKHGIAPGRAAAPGRQANIAKEHMTPEAFKSYEQSVKNQKSTQMTDVELEELHQLRQERETGKLNADDASRLEHLENKDKGLGHRLSEEEASYIQAEREALDGQHGVEVVTDIEPGSPFSGQVATINRRTNKIRINPAELSLVLKDIPKDRRAAYVKSLIAEESIHLKTADADAQNYWDNLTAVEKRIVKSRYTGTISGENPHGGTIRDVDFGHEAMRAQVQQLQGMDATEIASTVGARRMSLKALLAIETGILNVRKALGTKASKEQVRILDQVSGKIEKAKGILSKDDEGAPGSIRQGRENQSDYDKYQALVEKMRSASMEEKFSGVIQKEMEAIKNKYGGMPPLPESSAPGSIRQGALEKADAESLGKDIGFQFKEAGAFKMDGLPPEMRAEAEALNSKFGWEFTDKRSNTDTPGITFYTKRGATESEIRAAHQAKVNQVIAADIGAKYDGVVGDRASFTTTGDGPGSGANFTVKNGASKADIQAKMEATKKSFEEGGPSSIRQSFWMDKGGKLTEVENNPFRDSLIERLTSGSVNLKDREMPELHSQRRTDLPYNKNKYATSAKHSGDMIRKGNVRVHVEDSAIVVTSRIGINRFQRKQLINKARQEGKELIVKESDYDKGSTIYAPDSPASMRQGGFSGKEKKAQEALAAMSEWAGKHFDTFFGVNPKSHKDVMRVLDAIDGEGTGEFSKQDVKIFKALLTSEGGAEKFEQYKAATKELSNDEFQDFYDKLDSYRDDSGDQSFPASIRQGVPTGDQVLEKMRKKYASAEGGSLESNQAINEIREFIRQGLDFGDEAGYFNDAGKVKEGLSTKKIKEVESLMKLMTKASSFEKELLGRNEQSFPASIRQTPKRVHELAEQRRRIAEMRARARGEELPPELQTKSKPASFSAPEKSERPSTEAFNPLPRLSAKELEGRAGQEMSKEFKGADDRPSFEEFSGWAKRNMEGVKPEQLRDMWEDKVWSNLMSASGERLKQLQKALGITTVGRTPYEIRRGLRTDINIADAPGKVPFELELGIDRAEREAAKKSISGAQRHRNKVILAVARKLIGESVGGRASVERSSVGIDDVDFSNDKTKQGAYVEINKQDIADPLLLNGILRDQARGSSLDPESASKRLVAVVDSSGKVHLVSTFNDAGVQRVTDPAGPSIKNRPSRILNKSFLNQYRPFASVLVTDPVRGFKQTFDSVSEFMDKIGKEANERARVSEWEPAVAEGPAGDFEVDTPLSGGGGRGIPGQEGYLMGPRKGEITSIGHGSLESPSKITDAEARATLRSIADEVGNFQTSDDVRLSLDALKNKHESGKLTPADRVAISGYRKIFNELARKFPDIAQEELVERMAEKIYEDYTTSKDSEAFVKKVLGEFAPGGAEDVAGGKEQVALPKSADKSGKLPYEYGPSEPKKSPPSSEVGNARPEQTLTYALEDRSQGPASIRQVAKKTVREIPNILSNFGSGYDSWMVDRIERSGGIVSKEAAEAFRGIIDREKQFYGELTPSLDEARSLAGAGRPMKGVGQIPSISGMKAVDWANQLKPIKGAPFAARSNMVDAIEGRAFVPKFAEKLIAAAKQANLEIGLMMQMALSKFKASGLFERNITSVGYDIIRAGYGEMWNKWTAALARANSLPISKVRGFFKDWKKTLDAPDSDAAAVMSVHQDFSRRFKEVVTHIKGPTGAWEPVIHSDLFNYLENAARRATHARAFRQVWPHNQTGRQDLATVMADLRKELPPEIQKDVDAMMLTMQGHPTDNYSSMGVMGPTRAGGAALRMFNQTIGNAMAKMALTGQLFTQVGEALTGSTPVFLGYKNTIRAMARIKELYPQLELQGAVNRIIYDFSLDRNAPVRSLFKAGGNVLSKLFAEHALNEFQEATAAATAFVTAENIKSGNLSAWEKRMLPETFKAMGFTHDEVMGLMQGDANLLGQFQRKASAFLTSGNKAISEGSRLGANRLFNSVFRFQSYPMMKANQLRRVTMNLADAMENGNAQQKKNAAEMYSRFMFGNAAQGAITIAITALAYQGIMGAKIKANEAQDDPVNFLLESYLSTISGPLYMAWRGYKSKGVTGISENATRAAFPYTVVSELGDFARGAGRYKDLSQFDKIGEFLKSKTPGTKAISTGLAMAGLSSEDKKLDASIDAFFRWRRNSEGWRKSEGAINHKDEEGIENDEKRAEFKKVMKRAVEAMKAGDEDKFAEAYSEAFSLTDKKGSVEESMKHRKVLKSLTGGDLSPEQLDSLREHIGEDAVDRLEYFDLMIDEAAKGSLLPKYDE